ncbi:MAG: CDP-alcohol phosphatidyltransferase family protein [Gammaproteobacteria bacterium]|nr:CDP-alcohol phosphatidyltransferase family protein [Gammaproteobacteria bacterium]
MNSDNAVSVGKPVLWDELIARKLADALSVLPITPNHITLLTLLLTLIAGLLFATGDPWPANIAALLFMIVRLLDHVDGELARLKQSNSSFGHYFDWFVDTFSYAYLFLTLAIGFQDKMNTALLLIITSLAVSACLANTVIGLYKEKLTPANPSPSFPTFAGFGIDDSMYLIGPITWLGFLFYFFILCAIGSVIYIVTVIVKFILSSEK